MGQRGGDLEKGWNWKKGETVVIKFLLDHDCSSFHLWSIEREDGKKLRNNDFEEKPYISRFLEEVYGIKL